jgi:hypothetical protein
MLEKCGIVGAVVDLLRVQQNLVNLSGLREASNDLVGNVGAKVNAQRQGHVVQADEITELLAARKLRFKVNKLQAELVARKYLVLLKPLL